jgi:hypothetical protein
MARSLPSDFFVPEVAARYARQAFKDKITLFQQALAGAAGSPIRMIPPGAAEFQGDRIKVPLFKRISSLVTRRDLTSASAPSALKLDGDERHIPLLRRKVGPIQKSADVHKLNRFTAAEYSAEVGKQAGEEMAKDVQGTIFKAINGALGLTFNGTSHVLDQYEPYAKTNSDDDAGTIGNTMSIGLIAKGKQVLGDSSEELKSIAMHSGAMLDLQVQLAQSGNNALAAAVARTGEIATVGLAPYIMDLAEFSSSNPSGSRTGSGSGTGTASNTQRRAYLMAPDAIELTFVENLMFTVEGPKADAEAPYLIILGNYDFGVGIIGAGWKAASAANPTDANLLDSTLWEDVTADHRENGIVIVDHNLTTDN